MYNFGKIKQNIYEVAADGIADKDPVKRSILKKYISTVKESEILRTQANIYNNLESRVDTNDYSASEFVKENIALLQRFNISDIIRENKRLSILLEGYDVVDSYEHKTLHENIHNLIVTEKSPKTVGQLVESTTYVKDYILNNKPKEIVKESNFIPNSMLHKYLSEKFVAKYKDLLSESEANLLKVIVKGDDKEQSELYESTVADVLKTLNESIKYNTNNVEIKGKLLDVKERLLESKYNKETFVADIVKIMNLQKNLND
jgi:hypothetical protein